MERLNFTVKLNLFSNKKRKRNTKNETKQQCTLERFEPEFSLFPLEAAAIDDFVTINNKCETFITCTFAIPIDRYGNGARTRNAHSGSASTFVRIFRIANV